MPHIQTDTPEALGGATYSPEDNKLRIYAFHRLDEDGWSEPLPAGSFDISGTGVNVRLVVIDPGGR